MTAITAELRRVLDIAGRWPRPLPPLRRAAFAFIYRWLRVCARRGEHVYLDDGVQRGRGEYLAARARDVLAGAPRRAAGAVVVRFSRAQLEALDACRERCRGESRSACLKRLVREQHAHLERLTKDHADCATSESLAARMRALEVAKRDVRALEAGAAIWR